MASCSVGEYTATLPGITLTSATSVARDVQRLFGLMREVSAIMAGSAVLQMLCPLFDEVPNYDFFVPVQGADVLVQYLIVEEGYEMADEHRRTGRNGCSIADVEYLSGIARRTVLHRGTTVVNIIAVGAADDWDRAENAIASSWTTLLFNYAAADFIVVGYPTLTLLGRGLVQWDRALHPSFPAGTRMMELEKYTQRGYEFRTYAEDWDCAVNGLTKKCSLSSVCPLTPRSFADDGCLWIGVRRGARREMTTSWTFGGSPCSKACEHQGRRANEVHIDWCACGRGQRTSM